MTDFELDRRALARSFNSAARQYDAAASLQQRAGAELLDRLQYFKLKPDRILDLGAGTCSGAQALQRRYGDAQVLAMDIAPAMLQAMPRAYWPWRGRRIARVCADAYALPLIDQSVDLIYSNLMLQWCAQPDGVFREIARVLRPGGLLVFSTFGPDTLSELRAAWAAADEYSHVSLFADMPQLAEGLVRAGLAEPVIDVERYPQYYSDARALMQELKRLGARNAAVDRSRGLTGRARLQRMTSAYEALRTPQGLPATYELIFAAAFGGERSPPGRERSGRGAAGEYTVPLTALGRAR
jgi:malonyl-CoA O-methyltransferase